MTETAEKKTGIEGSGFDHLQRVIVDHKGEKQTKGYIESFHAGGKKVDVRIDHPGHKEHGRIVTFRTDEVDAE